MGMSVVYLQLSFGKSISHAAEEPLEKYIGTIIM